MIIHIGEITFLLIYIVDSDKCICLIRIFRHLRDEYFNKKKSSNLISNNTGRVGHTSVFPVN